MIHTILVPLDGSPWSEHALPTARSIAHCTGARLHLIHVHRPIQYVYLGAWNLGGVPLVDTTMDAEARQHEQAYLAALGDDLASASTVPITIDVIDGPTTEALLAYATDTPIDLVVMTTHGRGAWSRMWLGSVADRFLRHTTTPTLLVRPHDDQPDRDRVWRPQHMLVPLDGSPVAEQIIAPALALGTPMRSRYTLLHVIDPQTVDSHISYHDRLELEQEFVRPPVPETDAYLMGIARRFEISGCPVACRMMYHQSPAAAILAIAAQEPIDLIAIATHGRGGVSRLLLGSVADKVVRGQRCPS